ncbi:F-box only protein 30-like [Anableps anableps]
MSHFTPVALKMEPHVHCMSCVNQMCMVQSEPGVSCEIITCPLVCGAVFHSCKRDEHQLLCPLMRVPCLNSNYGCPAMLIRSKIPAHLDVCPAGIVFCTKRWNLHPTDILNLKPDWELGSVLDEIGNHRDLALALEDPQALFETIEEIGMEYLAYKDPVIDKECKEIQLALALSATQVSTSLLSSSHQSHSATKGSTTEEVVNEISCLDEVNLHKLYKAKAETGRSLTAALDFGSRISCVESNSEAEHGRGVLLNSCLNSNGNVQKELECTTFGDVDGLRKRDTKENCSCLSCSDESGALESIHGLSKNRTHGPLIRATDADASQEPMTPQMISSVHVSQGVAQQADHVVLDNKGLVLPGNLAPERTLPLNNFYVEGESHYPLSNEQLGVKPDKSSHRLQVEMEDKGVDTLELNQTVPVPIDPVSAALLSCLEKYKESSGISDTVYTDDHIDFGTQTFTYIPYTHSLMCGQSFRRDQYPSHYRNIHCDFHPNFRDHIESHCPLALYGCRFSQQRLCPSTQGARVFHHKQLKAFVIQPCINVEPATDSQSDRFSGLPIEILWHITGFLDSFSLCQLSLVSCTMREVCASLLPSRGIVELQWERGHFLGRPHTLRWQVKNKVWRFSTAFTPVYSWDFVDVPSISDHIKKCPFFNRAELKTEPVPLTAMCTEQDRLSILHCYHALRRLIA